MWSHEPFWRPFPIFEPHLPPQSAVESLDSCLTRRGQRLLWTSHPEWRSRWTGLLSVSQNGRLSGTVHWDRQTQFEPGTERKVKILQQNYIGKNTKNSNWKYFNRIKLLNCVLTLCPYWQYFTNVGHCPMGAAIPLSFFPPRVQRSPME